MTRTAIAPRVRPRKGAPRVPFQTLDLARSTSIHQLLPGTGLLVRMRHSVLSGFVSRYPYQKSNWSRALIASEPNARACRLGYSTGTITGRATNTVPVPVNTVPVAVRVRYNRAYPRCNRFTRGVEIPAGRW